MSYFDHEDESVTFVDCPTASYMTIRYSSYSDYLREVMLYVDDSLIGELVFLSTESYSNYDEVTFAIDIKEGADVMIKLENWAPLGINIDYIEFHD